MKIGSIDKSTWIILRTCWRICCGPSHTDSSKLNNILTISSYVYNGMWELGMPGHTHITEFTRLLTISIPKLLYGKTSSTSFLLKKKSHMFNIHSFLASLVFIPEQKDFMPYTYIDYHYSNAAILYCWLFCHFTSY